MWKVLFLGDNRESSLVRAHSLHQRGIESQVAPLSPRSITPNVMTYDAAIVDVYDHSDDALDLCQQLRPQFPRPLLLVSYEHDERYHLRAYEAGVDESITVPIGNLHFAAKVTAWLRRAQSTAGQAQYVGTSEFQLDTLHHRLVTPEGSTLRLSRLEYRLLLMLLSNRGSVLETELLIDRIWNGATTGDTHLLKNLVYRVRQKIEPEPCKPRYIHTVNGFGYVFRHE